MMYADSLMPTLEALARRAAEPEGVQVAWIELKRRKGSWVFRVFIEREDGGDGLVDCEKVGARLSVLLDVEDPIDASYTLEVSTPGLDRPLHGEEDYRRFRGRLARVKTKSAYRGRRKFRGRLAGVNDGELRIEEDGVGVVIPLPMIESGRLEVELDVPRPGSGRTRRKHA